MTERLLSVSSAVAENCFESHSHGLQKLARRHATDAYRPTSFFLCEVCEIRSIAFNASNVLIVSDVIR